MGARLDIINNMLSMAGEFTADADTDSHPDVVTCGRILDKVRKQILGKGWWFNTITMTLGVNASDQIEVPQSAMALDATDPARNVSIRGAVLYDHDNNSLTFTDGVECEVIQDLDEDDIPPIALSYIEWCAVVRFLAVQQVTGEPVADAKTAKADALVDLNAERYRKQDTNFNNTPMGRRMKTFQRRGVGSYNLARKTTDE